MQLLWEDGVWIYAQNATGTTGFIPQGYVIRVTPPSHLNIRRGASIPSITTSRTPTTPASRTTPYNAHHSTSSPLEANNQPHKSSSRRPEAVAETELDRISLPFGEIIMDDFDVFGRVSDDELDTVELDALEQFSKDEEIVTYQKFIKRPAGKYLVLHNFHGEQENDATVFKGKACH